METTRILGVKLNNIGMEQTLKTIDSLVKQGGNHLIVTLGVEMVMRAQRDKEFLSIVNDASLVVPDSVGILWAAKRSGVLVKERVTGIDILSNIAKNCKKYPWRAFFLGAKPGVCQKAACEIKKEYPEFNIVGTHHGYFDDDEEIIKKINNLSPNILFVALGSPYQEKWFFKNRNSFKNIVALGVGGSFDVISGSIKRAPSFIRKLGLEWAYRLACQPSRLCRMMALPKFALKVILKGV